jgi:3-methylcrotonyl-CoA carboxylase alpha subunit
MLFSINNQHHGLKMTKMFKKILIANRGEIACRVIDTCKKLGIETVAVYSDADCKAKHVAMADQAVNIGPPSPLESYLVVDKIIDAAKLTGADAIHPGYGFLSENGDFVNACKANGITFIGPDTEVMNVMGEKTSARKKMEKAGVPVVPGEYLPAPDGEKIDKEALRKAAQRVGFPILVKAAYGGGGKGMRLVTEPEELVSATEAAVREAIKAFGNGLVYLERYLTNPRHIEFQVFGDSHGNYVHLGERECSIQRRHQKIIEETPSTAVTPKIRQAMGKAAVSATEAVQYCGAGTIEFLLDEDGSFYFLEMNTRLQVEHPVTEMVTGLDLVEAQLIVSAGGKLPWTQDEIQFNGHSIECRIYAEDPANNFMPSLGKLVLYREPDARVDSGVTQNDEITMHYDPMISKLITFGQNREEATAKMLDALQNYPILGITTNSEYLSAILSHQAFADGNTTTSFLGNFFENWQPDTCVKSQVAMAIVSASQLKQSSPWGTIGHFRLNGMGPDFKLLNAENGQVDFILDGVVKKAWTVDNRLFLDGHICQFNATDDIDFQEADPESPHIVSDMPGKIVKLLVKQGDSVTKDQPLLIVEAMKMETEKRSPVDGTISTVFVEQGETVSEGDSLIDIIPEGE